MTTSPKAEAEERHLYEVFRIADECTGEPCAKSFRCFQAGHSAASSRWIPCSEKMPEIDRPVLICGADTGRHIEVMKRLNTAEWAHVGFSGNGEIILNHMIAHWQYLPLPPTEQP